MNFTHIALSNNIELFKDFVSQGLHKLEEVKVNYYYNALPTTTSDIIFKHAIPEIQELYYNMYMLELFYILV